MLKTSIARKLILVAGLSMAIVSSNASAEADLKGRITGSVNVSNSQASFSFEVENAGSLASQGTLRVKPFLLPTVAKRGATERGVVLPFANFQIDLAAGRTTTLNYSAELPNVPAGTYLMALILNSNAALNESDIVNNITDLVEVGRVSNSATPRGTANVNVYTELQGELNLYSGGASHSLRAIAANERPSFSPSQLWGRFLMANLSTRKVYTLPYNSSNTEKQWGSFAISEELGTDGRPVFIDYYSQAPIYENVPPGEYLYMTLINSHDLVEEKDTSDNLEYRAITLNPFRVIGVETVVLNSQNSLSYDLQINKLYQRNTEWSVQIPSNASWLSVGRTDGTLDGSSSTANINVRAAQGTLTTGTYRTEMTLTSRAFPGATVRVPVVFSVHGNNAPRFNISSTRLDYSCRQGTNPASQTLTIRNTGNAPLIFKAFANLIWMKLSVSEGEIAPGSSMDVTVAIDSAGLRIDNDFSGTIQFYNNADNSPASVSTNLSIERN